MILQVFAGNPGKRGITESLITLLATISWIHGMFQASPGMSGWTTCEVLEISSRQTSDLWESCSQQKPGYKARLHIFRHVFGVPWELRAHPQIAFGRWILVKPWVGCHQSFVGVYPSNLKHPSVEWGDPFGRWVSYLNEIDVAPSCGRKKTQSLTDIALPKTS